MKRPELLALLDVEGARLLREADTARRRLEAAVRTAEIIRDASSEAIARLTIEDLLAAIEEEATRG